MTAQAAFAPTSAGTVITEQSCAAPGTDTIPDSCTLLVRNTGAGTHIVTLGTAGLTFDGLNVGAAGAGTSVRTYSIAAAGVLLIKVPDTYGDANGRCNFGADGTAAEVKYSVIGA
jgi:hypothetical protein